MEEVKLVLRSKVLSKEELNALANIIQEEVMSLEVYKQSRVSVTVE
jgi:hypothetical protein